MSVEISQLSQILEEVLSFERLKTLLKVLLVNPKINSLDSNSLKFQKRWEVKSIGNIMQTLISVKISNKFFFNFLSSGVSYFVM